MMKILAIETSCDETSIAVVQASGPLKAPRFKILSNIVSSQIKLHARYGGVVPALAAREHEKNLIPVFKSALAKARVKLPNIDYLAVTQGPGLIPSLLLGVEFAKILAWRTKLPLIPVNHLEGHLYSNWGQAKEIKFPILNLIVSGGHTQLVLMSAPGKLRLLGETLDDAAGEAFDKVARLLDLGYPGGPEISKTAKTGKRDAFAFPRGMIKSGDFNFSFSGLKTAVLYAVQKIPKVKLKKEIPDICASFEEAAVDVLVQKARRAAAQHQAKIIMVSGGVAANTHLRKKMKRGFKIPVYFPKKELSTDNAAMIAMAGYMKILNSKSKLRGASWKKIEADANLRLKTN